MFPLLPAVVPHAHTDDATRKRHGRHVHAHVPRLVAPVLAAGIALGLLAAAAAVVLLAVDLHADVGVRGVFLAVAVAVPAPPLPNQAPPRLGAILAVRFLKCCPPFPAKGLQGALDPTRQDPARRSLHLRATLVSRAQQF